MPLLCCCYLFGSQCMSSCVIFFLHCTGTESVIKSFCPQHHPAVPEFGDSKCHLRKAQGLGLVRGFGTIVWSCVTWRTCSHCGLECECHSTAGCHLLFMYRGCPVSGCCERERSLYLAYQIMGNGEPVTVLHSELV